MALTRRFAGGEKEATVLTKLNERGMPVVSSTVDITNPFYGQMIFNTFDNAIYRYNGTQFVPMVGPQLVTQLADLVVSNSITLEDSPDLVLPVAPNGSYVLESELIVDTNSTADSQINFTTPAGSGIRLAYWAFDGSAAASETNIFINAIDSGGPVVFGGVTFGQMVTGRPSGWFINGPNLGEVRVQFAQNVATVVNSALKTGSWLKLTRIA